RKLQIAAKYTSTSNTKRPARDRSSPAGFWMPWAAPPWTSRAGSHDLQRRLDECRHFRQSVLAADVYEVKNRSLLGPPLREGRDESAGLQGILRHEVG